MTANPVDFATRSEMIEALIDLPAPNRGDSMDFSAPDYL